MIGREALLAGLQAALAPREDTLAAWQGGSVAFGRNDAYSDLDLCVLVPDGCEDTVFAVIEATLEAISPISLRYAFPSPTWHGHAQRLYQLRDTDEHLMLDVVVLHASSPNRFREPQRHGTPAVLFDKGDHLAPPPVDPVAWRARLRARVADLDARFRLLQPLPRKAALRGLVVEARETYMAHTLRPLVELLRIHHCPWRHDFGLRYLQLDLPEKVYAKLVELTDVRDCADVLAKQAKAERWFLAELEALDVGKLAL